MALSELANIISALRQGNEWRSYIEQEAIRRIIIPILREVDWPLSDPSQVARPFRTDPGLVDFALLRDSLPELFIEAKQPSDRLANHEYQLFNYCFEFVVPMAALTNGVCWWLYLPMHRSNWRERRFMEIDLLSGSPEENAEALTKWLCPTSVFSNDSIKEATELLNQKKRGRRNRSRSDAKGSRPSPRAPIATASGGLTKLQMVHDLLRNDWVSGSELNSIMGWTGGYPKWAFNNYVRSGKYGTLLLLRKSEGRARLLRLATPEESLTICTDPTVRIYPD